MIRWAGAHIYFGQCCIFEKILQYNDFCNCFILVYFVVTDSSWFIFSVLYFSLNSFDK